MEEFDIPVIFQSRLRLMIISALLTGNKTFHQLKEQTGATDGNISVQISNLEKIGYVTVKKSIVRKRPMTTVSITPEAIRAFREYIDTLNRILEEAENAEEGE